jgi:hypothetical protein
MRVNTSSNRIPGNAQSIKHAGGHLPHRLNRSLFKAVRSGWGCPKVSPLKSRSRRIHGILTKPLRWKPVHPVNSPKPTPVAVRQDYERVDPLEVLDSMESLDAAEPREVLSVVGDLWLRLARLCPVTVTRSGDDDSDGGGFEVRFADLVANDWDQDALALIRVVLDRQSYRWRHDGKPGDLLQWLEWLEWQGRDLVLMTSSLKQMTRWVEGLSGSNESGLANQFGSLLSRFQFGSRTC